MNGHRLGELRRRMGATARAVADTEDRLAGTLERLAITRPGEAVRLRAHAAQAREYADVERRRAAEYAPEATLARPLAERGDEGLPARLSASSPPASGAPAARSAGIEDLLT